ncbi:MAG: hypothetical protein QM493_01420 [Sulfurovum sp.]
MHYMKTQGITHENHLYGIFLGKAYNTGLIKSTKSLLTTKMLEESQKDDLSLHINELETLTLDEARESLFTVSKKNYMQKLNKKIGELVLFSKKIKSALGSKMQEDTFSNIFHHEIEVFGIMANKVVNRQNYFINKRDRIQKIFFESLSKEEEKCIIVFPLDTIDSRFLKESHFSKLHFKKLNIVRIFIINKIDDLTIYIQDELKILSETSEVKIVYRKDIPSLNSFDFMYSNLGTTAVYKSTQDRIHSIKITEDSDKIKQLKNNYEDILYKSYTLEEILKPTSISQTHHKNL